MKCLYTYYLHVRNLNITEESCNTPLGLKGKCVDMDNCPPILSITKGQMRRNGSLFIKNSHCRNDRVNGKIVLIMCCQIDRKIYISFKYLRLSIILYQLIFIKKYFSL